MSDRRIIVEPRDGGFGFNVRYCSDHISLPGYSCETKDNWTMELRKVLPRYGCSPKQVHVILMLMKKEMDECLVKGNAEVDLFPDQEEDEKDDEDYEAEEEEEEEDEDE